VQTRVTTETYASVSNLNPYTVYRLSVSCIPALRDADARLEPRGFWSDAVIVDARTLPDGQ